MLESPSRVSVVIPAYNGRSFVHDALTSVLTQSHEALEVIVIDDGSTDDTAAVVGRFPAVRYVFQEHAGIGAARNRGVEEANGDLLAFLDADDIWEPAKLALQTSALAAQPDLDIVFGHVRQFRGRSPGEAVHTTPASVPGHIPSTMLIRKDAFHRVGLFETNWTMGEFASWYLRSLERGIRNRMLPDLVAWRRLHHANNGRRHRDSMRDYVHILKASLDRRRGAGHERRS